MGKTTTKVMYRHGKSADVATTEVENYAAAGWCETPDEDREENGETVGNNAAVPAAADDSNSADSGDSEKTGLDDDAAIELLVEHFESQVAEVKPSPQEASEWIGQPLAVRVINAAWKKYRS